MSHPNPSHDPENVYPNDSMPASSKSKALDNKIKGKKKKFTAHPESKLGKLKKLIGESENLRKNQL